MNQNDDSVVGNVNTLPVVYQTASSCPMTNATPPPTVFKERPTEVFFSDRRKLTGKFSYAELVEKAIRTSPTEQMTLSQIYEWLWQNVEDIRNGGRDWKNSVRHNLSLHSRFVQVPKAAQRKGLLWTLNREGTTRLKGKKRTATQGSRKKLSASYKKVYGQTQQHLHASFADHLDPASVLREYFPESLSPVRADTCDKYFPQAPACLPAEILCPAFGASHNPREMPVENILISQIPGNESVSCKKANGHANFHYHPVPTAAIRGYPPEPLSPLVADTCDEYFTQTHLPAVALSAYVPNTAFVASQHSRGRLVDNIPISQIALSHENKSVFCKTANGQTQEHLHVNFPAYQPCPASVSKGYPESQVAGTCDEYFKQPQARLRTGKYSDLSFGNLGTQTQSHIPCSTFSAFTPRPAFGSKEYQVASLSSGVAYNPNFDFSSGKYRVESPFSAGGGTSVGLPSELTPEWSDNRGQHFGSGCFHDSPNRVQCTPLTNVEVCMPFRQECSTLDEIIHDLGIGQMDSEPNMG